MRILMVAPDYLPNIGGIAAHVYELSSALQNLGHHVVVLNPIPGPEFTFTPDPTADLPTYRIAYRAKFHMRNGWFTLVPLLRAVRRIVQDQGPFDIIHQHDYLTTILAMNYLRKYARWIWTNHTSIFLQALQRPMTLMVVQALYARMHGLLAPSRELHEESCKIWPHTPARYVPNGVNIARFHPSVASAREVFGLRRTDTVVLCPRRMEPKNGVIHLAHAVVRLANANQLDGIKFLFLGSDAATNIDMDYAREVKSVLAPYVESGHVKLCGNVPYAEMPKVNALADIVVLPSLMEAVSLSALEAMASRRAVVATRVGGLPEIVHHERTGLLVPPGEPESLAAAIVRLQESCALRESIGDGGYALATQDYGWASIARQTADFYQYVIDLSGLPRA